LHNFFSVTLLRRFRDSDCIVELADRVYSVRRPWSPRDFRVTIDWGDGTHAAAGAVSRVGNRFRVHGSHAYVTNGSYTIRTLVTSEGKVLCNKSRTVRVVPFQLRMEVRRVEFTPGQPANNVVVAELTVDNPLAPAEDYSALIIWGAGTPIDSNVSIVGGRGTFRVIASHTYKDFSHDPLRVILFQVWH
jgi:hypothetical protein